MQAKISPTSPKYPSPDPVVKVWQSSQLQQPPRTPWGRLWLLIIFVSLLVNAAVLVGLGWYVHGSPQGWLSQWLPTTTKTTTIVQPTNQKVVTLVQPTAVTAVSQAVYEVNVDQGANGLYTDATRSGFAWPLSSSGWLLTLNATLPANPTGTVVVPDIGQPTTVVSRLLDPATPFAFLKVSQLNDQPVTFITPDQTDWRNKTVWVVGQHVAVARQLININGPRWSSSDHLDYSWTLDAPVQLPTGGAVVDVDGHLIGLLDQQGHVWPVDSLTALLKQVLQQGTATRPVLGLRSANLTTAVVTNQPILTGAMIGAEAGQTAVVVKSPADKAGLKTGDVITALDRQPVNRDLFGLIMNFPAGDQVEVGYTRGGQTHTATVTLGSQ